MVVFAIAVFFFPPSLFPLKCSSLLELARPDFEPVLYLERCESRGHKSKQNAEAEKKNRTGNAHLTISKCRIQWVYTQGFMLVVVLHRVHSDELNAYHVMLIIRHGIRPGS